MKRNKLGALALAVTATGVLLVGCGNGEESDAVSTVPETVSEQTEESEPVFVRKDEPDEEKDVLSLKLVERQENDYTGPTMYATCVVKNNTDEVVDYSIKAALAWGNASSYKSAWFMVNDVPPGKTVPCGEERIGSGYTLSEWNIKPTFIDRSSNEEGYETDDFGTYTATLKEKVVNGVPGVSLDWSVNNTADEVMGYLVKYQVSYDATGEILKTSTFETKGLKPWSEPGYIQQGSIRLPDEVVQGKDFTVNESGEIQGMKVTVLDVDRITYFEKGVESSP